MHEGSGCQTLDSVPRCAKKNNLNSEECNKLTGATAYLLVLCHKNGITNDMFVFPQDEQAEAIQLANEILRKKLIYLCSQSSC